MKDCQDRWSRWKLENQQKLKKYLIDFKYTHIEHPKFFAPKQQYVSPVLRELKNKENQEYIKKLYNEYLNNEHIGNIICV